ncbi:MAG TPA: hypothetical protein P5534_03310 [Candidatus Paceibacterota bacterium]|nr:hypothetical protein [Candidatus Paceibacterota bacterium]
MGITFDLQEADARRLFPTPAPRRSTESKPVRQRRWVPRRCRRLWIARDTRIVPDDLAADLCHQVGRWLGVELPRSWPVRLAVKADVVYYHNRRFRQGVRREGRAGVRFLRTFMQHWLAALLSRRWPDWGERLPPGFERGAEWASHSPAEEGTGACG